MQLRSSSGQTSAIVVSTLMEACEVVKAGLVADGTVTDVSQQLCGVGTDRLKRLGFNRSSTVSRFRPTRSQTSLRFGTKSQSTGQLSEF